MRRLRMEFEESRSCEARRRLLAACDAAQPKWAKSRFDGALVDRLTHHVHILPMNRKSYRLALHAAKSHVCKEEVVARHRDNVWAYAVGPGFGRADEEGRLAALHPTVKPTAMIADAILDVTRRGDIILDPFLGSGSNSDGLRADGAKLLWARTRPDLLRRHRASLAGLFRRRGASGDDWRELRRRGCDAAWDRG